ALAQPNDPLLPRQWPLTAAAGIDVARAWSLGPGAPVTVAVIDSGVDARCPDLASSVWTNPGEIPGNGKDDEGNGYADDVHGFNFLTGTPDQADDNGHGTAMASVIAARGGDRFGMAGVAWNARVMALKAVDASGTPSDPAVAAAI